MARGRMDIVTANLPEVAMHLKRLAVAITGALMLCESTGIAGAPVIMTFRADHAGRFPIEAHGTQADALGRTDSGLAYLEVRPE